MDKLNRPAFQRIVAPALDLRGHPGFSMGRLTDFIIGVISQKAGKRNSQDIKTVLPWLMKTSAAFAAAPQASLHDIIQFCEYRKVKRDDVIIRQGDKGNEFFVMLNGKSSVYIDAEKTGENVPLNEPEEVDGLGFTREEKEKQQKIAAKIKTFINELDREDPKKKNKVIDKSEDYKLDRTQFGKFIIQYGDGKSFGEIALMSEDSIRNATIIADDDSNLLVISRELFNKSLKEQQEKEYAERAQFISKSPFFNWWTPRFKRLLEMSIRKEVFPYGSFIVQQGQPFQGLHFITKGRAVVLTAPNDHQKQFPSVINSHKLSLESEDEKSTDRELRQERVRLRRSDGYAAAEAHERLKLNEVAHVCAGDLIGDVEYVTSLDAYCTSVVANSEVHCLLLDTKNIERLLHKKHQLTIDQVAATVTQKLEVRSRQRLPDGSKVVLFDALYQGMDRKTPPLPESPSHTTTPASHGDPSTRQIRQQMRLFLNDKASLVQPCLRDSVMVRAKSARRQKYWEKRLQERDATSAKTQQERVRRYQASRRTPFSIRQLQRMTVGPGGGLVDAAVQKAPIRATEYFRRVSTAGDSEIDREADEEEEEEDSEDPEDKEEEATNERVKHLLATTAVNPDVDTKTSTNVWMMIKMVKRLQEVRKLREERKLSRSVSAPPPPEQSIFVTELQSRRSGSTSSMNSARRPSRPASVINTAFDWETSDEVLEELEHRMQGFLGGLLADQKSARGCPSPQNTKSDIFKLHRFEVDPDKIPLPGGTVVIWPRPCLAESRTADHEHIRHHILPKNALAVMQSLRATNMKRDKEVHRSAAARRCEATARQQPSNPPPIPEVSVSELTRTLKKTRDRTREDFREIIRQTRRPEK